MRSARDFAPIFLMTCPRWIFTVDSASPVFAATCLFINPDITRAITSRSRGLESLKQSAYPGCRFNAFPAYAITLDGDRDGIQHVLLAEWFRQEIDRARLHRSRRHGYIGVSGHEDDGDVDIRAGKLGLKIEAAHARQPDVEHQTACGIGQLARQEFGRRAEYLGLQADVSEEIVKRLSHRDIVVDDEDNRILRIARKPRVDGTFPC